MPYDYSQAIQGALSLLNPGQPVDTTEDTSYLTPDAVALPPGYAQRAALAGLMAPTRSGSTSESVSNSLTGQNAADLAAAKLRAEYYPAIANAMTQKMIAQANARDINSQAALRQLQGIQAARMQELLQPFYQRLAGGPGAAPGAVPPGQVPGVAPAGMPGTVPVPGGMPGGVQPPVGVPAGGLGLTREDAYALKGLGGPDMTGYFDNGKPITARGPVYDWVNHQWINIPTGMTEDTEAAKARGRAAYQLQKVWDPNANGGSGGYVYQTMRNVADSATVAPGQPPAPGIVPGVMQAESGGNPNAVSPKGATGGMQLMPGTAQDLGVNPKDPLENTAGGVSYLGRLRQKYGNDEVALAAYNWGPTNVNKWLANGGDFSKLPAETQQYVQTVMQNTPKGAPASAPAAAPAPQAAPPKPLAAEAPFGAEKATEDQIENMQKAWAPLQESNRQAEATVSYLQEIKALAPKAGTGQFSDKLQYVNSLLSPFNQKATDDVTAKNLLDKYSNQIVTRLGQGGLGTDAARELLAAAYPNSHMTPDAISQAADNLIGAQRMAQAKTNLLQPYYAKKDANGYMAAETKFDQAADPRVWQYLSITDPKQRKAFASTVYKQDPNFPKKLATLEQLGVIHQ
jgi:hypothetical protein